MKREKPATFMSNPEAIGFGGYPPQWSKSEQEVYAELKGKDWTYGSVLRDVMTLSMHTINNSLRRLSMRGVVERKPTEKGVMWRIIDDTK